MDLIEREVRERAYFIWEGEGRSLGRAEAHWLQAEAELRSRIAPPVRIESVAADAVLAPSPAKVLKPRAKAPAKVALTDVAVPAKPAAKKAAAPKAKAASKSTALKATAAKSSAPKVKAATAKSRVPLADAAVGVSLH